MSRPPVIYATVLHGNGLMRHARALLNSLVATYDGSPPPILLYHSGLDASELSELCRISPTIAGRESGRTIEGKDGTTRAASKTHIWAQIVEEAEDGVQLALIDCDTVVIKPLERFFADDFDVAYTYKTHEEENLSQPLNTGVLLIKVTDATRRFMRDWARGTDELFGKSGIRRDWGAEDQAALGTMLGTREQEAYARPIRAGGCTLLGYPCEYLNEVRCAP